MIVKIDNPISEALLVAGIATVIGLTVSEAMHIGKPDKRTVEERVSFMVAGFATGLLVHIVLKKLIVIK